MSDRVRPNPDEMTAIDAVFRPKRVAVLGASADPTKFGHHLVRNLKAFEFPGDVYPISRSAAEICGCRTFPSLHDLPDPVDLVLVSIPVQHVAAGIADAASVSAKAAVVFTAGFQEVGDEGRKLQQDVVASAAGRIRLIGPNCLGIRNFHLPMNASPMPHAVLAPGPIAFISQSGAFGNAAIAALRNLRIGLSKLASIGNMADLTHAHLFRYFAEDEETSVITAFVEGVPDVPFFLDTIAGVSRVKPILILKGGRSHSGQRAALSHTGSLAGDGRVWENLLREAGATFVGSSEELFDVAAALARCGRLPQGRRAAIFSLAGGPGVVAADHCEERGIAVPPLEEQLQSLRPIVPPFAALGNPVEVTGQTKREHFGTCAQAIVAQPTVDAMVGIAIGLDFPEFAQSIIGAREVKPVVTCVVAPNSETIFADAGVPNYPSVDRAVRALGHLMDRGEALRRSPAGEAGMVAARPLRSGVHSEAEFESLPRRLRAARYSRGGGRRPRGRGLGGRPHRLSGRAQGLVRRDRAQVGGRRRPARTPGSGRRRGGRPHHGRTVSRRRSAGAGDGDRRRRVDRRRAANARDRAGDHARHRRHLRRSARRRGVLPGACFARTRFVPRSAACARNACSTATAACRR